MEQAIKKAIEGGYITGFVYERLAAIDSLGAVEILLLDPKWWQALGKAEGWEKEDEITKSTYKLSGGNPEYMSVQLYQWFRSWHRFIIHLAQGKPVDDFFNNLLK